MSNGNENIPFKINQKPRDKEKDKAEKKKNIRAALKITFNIIIQLLPVWFMLLLAILTNVEFDMMDCISNILIFVIMSSITNIVSWQENKHLDVQADFMKYMSGLILCFSLFFYTLILIGDSIDLGIRAVPMLGIAFIFCIIVFMSLFFQEVRRVNGKR